MSEDTRVPRFIINEDTCFFVGDGEDSTLLPLVINEDTQLFSFGDE
jgi:hypothetical protein